MEKILIVKLGGRDADYAAKYGDYEDWFIKGMGVDNNAVDIINPLKNEKLPDKINYTGVILTGSVSYVTDKAAWSEYTAKWVPEVMKQNIPLLGVCYGHQLIAHALGCKIDFNSYGRAMGSVEVEFLKSAEKDRFFSCVYPKAVVQISHSQFVVDVPEEATVHAYNKHGSIYAYSIGDRTWSVQYHPEFSDDEIRRSIIMKKDVIKKEGKDYKEMLDSLKPSKDGETMLRRFVEITRG